MRATYSTSAKTDPRSPSHGLVTVRTNGSAVRSGALHRQRLAYYQQIRADFSFFGKT